MKGISIILFIVAFVNLAKAQVPTGQDLLGLHHVSNEEIAKISDPVVGSLLFNTTDQRMYLFSKLGWNPSGSTSGEGWNLDGNSNYSSEKHFLGSTNLQDLVFKTNNTERVRFIGKIGQILINQAKSFNEHPLVVRANGVDVLAFQNESGETKWHWNILNGGLNFVETGVADYILFLQYGGNVGFNTEKPEYTADINGTARIVKTPSIDTATNALVKDPNTGQISEQKISSKFLQTIMGRAYFYNNNWYSTSDAYGTSYSHWNQYKGTSTNPTYNTTGQSGIPITSDMTLAKFIMKNDFNSNPSGAQYINLSVLRGNSYLSIGNYKISGGKTTVTMHPEDVDFELKANDLLVWACRTVGGINRLSYASLTFEFEY